MTEFFKLIGLKLEAEWLKFLADHGIVATRTFFYEDIIASHTNYYHQDEFETGGVSSSSCIYLWIKGHRRITISFEQGVLSSIEVPTTSKVRI